MPPFLIPFALLFAFFREVWLALKNPQFRSLFFWLAIVLLTGTIVYHEFEGWSWVDSFYFCVVTLATVGYGDFAPEQPATRMFTTVYILIGFGFLATFVNLLTKERMKIHAQRLGEKNESNVLNDDDKLSSKNI